MNDSAVFCGEFAILKTQSLLLIDVFFCKFVSVVGRIVLSTLNGEGNITSVEQLDSVGMASHHGSSSQRICHDGTQMICSVSSSRVAANKHFIGVDKP